MAFETIDAIPLLIVIFFAFIIPIIISRIKKVSIPIVVGELIVGLVIGVSGLNIIPHDDPWLEFLMFLGFAFLMFLAGIETDFEHLLHPEIKKSIQEKLEEHYIDKTFTEIEKAQIPSEEELGNNSKHHRFLIKYIKEKALQHRIHRHWNFSDLELSNKPYAIGMLSYLFSQKLS